MKINIGEYLIESDSLQFVVKERKVKQDGEKKGEEYWTNPKYIVKFCDVLRYITEQILRTNDDMDIILDKLEQINQAIGELKNYPVIYIRSEKEENKDKLDFEEAEKEIEQAIDEYINNDEQEEDFEVELDKIEKYNLKEREENE